MKRFQALLMILTVIGLAGCSALQPGDSLNGSSWTLSQLNGHSLLPGSTITISFEEDRFSGNAGCNYYGGSYRGRGENFSISEGIEMTAMYCETPEEIMSQEGEYADALSSAVSYQANGTQLEMQDAEGSTVLVFILDEPVVDADLGALNDTEWAVRTVDDESLMPGSQITMRFTQPGKVTGFGSCRGFEASYVETDDGVRFTSISMNEETCSDEALLLQEQNFTDFLFNTRHLELVDELLVLHTEQTGEVVFEPVE